MKKLDQKYEDHHFSERIDEVGNMQSETKLKYKKKIREEGIEYSRQYHDLDRKYKESLGALTQFQQDRIRQLEEEEATFVDNWETTRANIQRAEEEAEVEFNERIRKVQEEYNQRFQETQTLIDDVEAKLQRFSDQGNVDKRSDSYIEGMNAFYKRLGF